MNLAEFKIYLCDRQAIRIFPFLKNLERSLTILFGGFELSLIILASSKLVDFPR